MQKFEMSLAERLSLAPHHGEFQAAVAVIANRKLGIETDMPEGISKYEGGVRVNGREIAIKDCHVIDDWSKPAAPSPEETAVAQAIREVTDSYKRQGVSAFAPFHGKRLKRGDPLRALLLDFVPQ